MSKEWKEPRRNNAARIFGEFPNIPKRKFTRKEFRMLVKVLSDVLAEWKGIGLCLGIVHKMMENLQDKWRKNPTMGLISVVDEWMKGNYDEKELYPCWYSVVYIVADGLGGQNPAAAREIAQRWKTYEGDPFFSCPVAKEADKTELHKLGGSRGRFIQQLWNDYLQSVSHCWFEIGALLGVPINKLQEIETNKLLEVIKVWVKLYDDFQYDYLPAPTIQILVDAVDNIMGGNDKDLAKRIADEVDVSRSIAHSSISTSVTQADPQEQAGTDNLPQKIEPAEDIKRVKYSQAIQPGDPSAALPGCVEALEASPSLGTSEANMPTRMETDADDEIEHCKELESEESSCDEVTAVADGTRSETRQAQDRGTYTPHLQLKDSETDFTPVKPQARRQMVKHQYYPMASRRHGVALIVNNKLFQDNSERKGSDRDEANLVQTWLYLGYRVEVRRNLTSVEFSEIFKDIDRFLKTSDEYAGEDNAVSHDSFVSCFLSHGSKDNIIGVDRVSIEMDNIESMIGKSVKLRSKPKLFFIQACRGWRPGADVQSDDDGEYKPRVTNRSDMHFSYATVPGNKSYRSTTRGSWFITELCKILCKFAPSHTLDEIQHRVNSAVPGNTEYKVPSSDPRGAEYAQQPASGGGTMTKCVHFFDCPAENN